MCVVGCHRRSNYGTATDRWGCSGGALTSARRHSIVRGARGAVNSRLAACLRLLRLLASKVANVAFFFLFFCWVVEGPPECYNRLI